MFYLISSSGCKTNKWIFFLLQKKNKIKEVIKENIKLNPTYAVFY